MRMALFFPTPSSIPSIPGGIDEILSAYCVPWNGLAAGKVETNKTESFQLSNFFAIRKKD